MPDFGNPFSGLNSDRKLNKEELIRAMRFLIAAEYEAVQLYTQLADSIDDEKSAKVLRDVAEEEVVHAGEFLRLLIHLRPEEFKSYLEGIKETEDIIKTAKYFTKDNVLYWKTPSGKIYPVEVFAPNEGGLFRTIMPQKKGQKIAIANIIRVKANWMLITNSIKKSETDVKNLKDWINDINDKKLKDKLLQILYSLNKNIKNIKEESEKTFLS